MEMEPVRLSDFVITYLGEILEDSERTIASYGLWDAHQLLVHENRDAANSNRYKRKLIEIEQDMQVLFTYFNLAVWPQITGSRGTQINVLQRISHQRVKNVQIVENKQRNIQN